MKKHSPILLLIIFIMSGCAGLGVATASAVIYYYKSSQHEVATVNIRAKAENVYSVATSTIKNNNSVELISINDESRLLEIKRGNKFASIKVSHTQNGYTLLTITSNAPEEPQSGTKLVLNGVFEICKKMNIKCTLSDDSK